MLRVCGCWCHFCVRCEPGLMWSRDRLGDFKLDHDGFTAGIEDPHVYEHTHHVPQEEKPIVWMRAKTHWRKKMKKKAMKLNELSALSTWWKKKTERWEERFLYHPVSVVSSYLPLMIDLKPHIYVKIDFMPIMQRDLTTTDDGDGAPFCYWWFWFNEHNV